MEVSSELQAPIALPHKRAFGTHFIEGGWVLSRSGRCGELEVCCPCPQIRFCKKYLEVLALNNTCLFRRTTVYTPAVSTYSVRELIIWLISTNL